MFKIYPLSNPEERAEMAKQIPIADDSFVYLMRDCETDVPMGYAEFDLSEGTASISALKEIPDSESFSDFEAMFILGRQTLNFIDKLGIFDTAAAADAGKERLLLAVGFKKQEDGGYFIHTEGMFDGHCDGHPVKL